MEERVTDAEGDAGVDAPALPKGDDSGEAADDVLAPEVEAPRVTEGGADENGMTPDAVSDRVTVPETVAGEAAPAPPTAADDPRSATAAIDPKPARPIELTLLFQDHGVKGFDEDRETGTAEPGPAPDDTGAAVEPEPAEEFAPDLEETVAVEAEPAEESQPVEPPEPVEEPLEMDPAPAEVPEPVVEQTATEAPEPAVEAESVVVRPAVASEPAAAAEEEVQPVVSEAVPVPPVVPEPAVLTRVEAGRVVRSRTEPAAGLTAGPAVQTAKKQELFEGWIKYGRSEPPAAPAVEMASEPPRLTMTRQAVFADLIGLSYGVAEAGQPEAGGAGVVVGESTVEMAETTLTLAVEEETPDGGKETEEGAVDDNAASGEVVETVESEVSAGLTAEETDDVTGEADDTPEMATVREPEYWGAPSVVPLMPLPEKPLFPPPEMKKTPPQPDGHPVAEPPVRPRGPLPPTPVLQVVPTPGRRERLAADREAALMMTRARSEAYREEETPPMGPTAETVAAAWEAASTVAAVREGYLPPVMAEAPPVISEPEPRLEETPAVAPEAEGPRITEEPPQAPPEAEVPVPEPVVAEQPAAQAAPQVEEPLPQVEEPLPQVEEPLPQVEEPAPEVSEEEAQAAIAAAEEALWTVGEDEEEEADDAVTPELVAQIARKVAEEAAGVAPAPSRGGDYVPVEGLGLGIVNLLGDAVGGVIRTGRGVGALVGGRKKSSGRNAVIQETMRLPAPLPAPEPASAFESSALMGGRVVHGVSGILSGTGAILVGGRDIVVGAVGCVTGTVGCVTDAVFCVGAVLTGGSTAGHVRLIRETEGTPRQAGYDA